MSIGDLSAAIQAMSLHIAKANTDIMETLTPVIEHGLLLLNRIQKQITDTKEAAKNESTIIVDVLKDSGEQVEQASGKVSSTLQAMKITAKKHVDDTTAAAQQGQRDVATSANVIGNALDDVKTQATDTANSVIDSMGAAQTAIETVFDLYKHGPSGLSLEELVPHQQDAIKKIEGTLFGGYLDQYANIYEKIKEGGAQLSPQALINYTNALTGIESIIRKFSGAAGFSFSFDEFRRDLDELMAAQKATAKSGGKVAGGTSSTGAAGSPAPATGTTGGNNLLLANWRGGVP